MEEDLANSQSHHDFGMDVIPRVVKEGTAYAHPFSLSCVGCCPQKRLYWRDVGIRLLCRNMDIPARWTPSSTSTIRLAHLTSQKMTAPAKFVQDQNGQHGMTINSLFAGGTIVSGSFIVSSVLFNNVVDSSAPWIAVISSRVEIGAGCRLRRVVIDKGCRLPEGLVVGRTPARMPPVFSRAGGGAGGGPPGGGGRGWGPRRPPPPGAATNTKKEPRQWRVSCCQPTLSGGRALSAAVPGRSGRVRTTRTSPPRSCRSNCRRTPGSPAW
ncbi:hypothetical protein [Aeromonas sp. Marseille-Q7275]